MFVNIVSRAVIMETCSTARKRAQSEMLNTNDVVVTFKGEQSTQDSPEKSKEPSLTVKTTVEDDMIDDLDPVSDAIMLKPPQPFKELPGDDFNE